MSNNQQNLQQVREDIRQLTNNIISILNDYNRNIESYNNNLNNALTNVIRLQTSIINSELQNINSRQNLQSVYQNRYSNVERETANSLLNLFLNRRTSPGTRYTTFTNNNNNINRPLNSRNLTREQINSLTEIISYNEHMTEVRCPITWEEFTIGENISRIRNCGHIFKTASLNNWLRTNNVCPVCRQNILNYNNQTTPIPVATSQNTNQNIEPIEESSSDDEDNQNEIIVDMEINSNDANIQNIINSIFRDISSFPLASRRDLSGNFI